MVYWGMTRLNWNVIWVLGKLIFFLYVHFCLNFHPNEQETSLRTNCPERMWSTRRYFNQICNKLHWKVIYKLLNFRWNSYHCTFSFIIFDRLINFLSEIEVKWYRGRLTASSVISSNYHVFNIRAYFQIYLWNYQLCHHCENRSNISFTFLSAFCALRNFSHPVIRFFWSLFNFWRNSIGIFKYLLNT